MDETTSIEPGASPRRSLALKVAFAVFLVLVAVIFSFYLYAKADSRAMLVISLATTLLVSAFAIVVAFDPGALVRRHPVRLFGVALLASCAIYTFALTPFAMPDEYRHYFASYWMSDCIMGQADFAGMEPFPVRQVDLDFATEAPNPSRLHNDMYHWVTEQAELFASSDDYGVSTRVYTITNDPPQSRLGSVLGLTLGRLLNLGAVPTYYLGRLGSSLLFALLAIWAVKVSPFGQRMLMAIALLPITVSLAASYSYDSGIISLALLSFAYLMRAVHGEGRLGARDIVPICVLALLLTPCKVIYSAVFALVLLVPNRRFSSPARAWLFRIGVLGIAFVALLLSRMYSVVGLMQGAEESARGTEMGRFYSMGDLLADPVGAVLLFLRSFEAYGGNVFLQALGSNLGSLQGEVTATGWLRAIYFLLLVLASVRANDDDQPVPVRHAVFMVVIGFLGTLAVWVSMCFGWTFVGERYIQGVQGRYFIPYIPLFMVACRCLSVRWAKAGSAVTVASAMAYFNVFYVMWVMATALLL